MTSSPLILVVEDDPEISQLLLTLLKSADYRVELAETGVKGLVLARQLQPALILLDRQLPDMDGMDICRRLRKGSAVPIILLTSLAQVNDKISGLDSGANDYIAKPFDVSELLVRIRVQLREVSQPQHQLSWHQLLLDEFLHQVSWRQQIIELTPKEYELLRQFMLSPEKVIERSRLVMQVWGWASDGQDKVLDVTMHTLRQKMEKVIGQRLIETVRGIGFVLRKPQD